MNQELIELLEPYIKDIIDKPIAKKDYETWSKLLMFYTWLKEREDVQHGIS